MPYGPETPVSDIKSDAAALAIVTRHLPRVVTHPEFDLSASLALGQLLHHARSLGEPAPDLGLIWHELNALDGPAIAPRDDQGMQGSGRAILHPPAVAAQWEVAEVALVGGPTLGNPFIDVELTATFRAGDDHVLVGGFYDGVGTYRIRFCPPAPGVWSFVTRSNSASLDGLTGEVKVGPPAPGNRGRVVVREQFHFAYQDGTPYLPLGTTAYAWTHQAAELEDTTVRSLAASPFTKVRMCVFPKSYLYNTGEPAREPYERDPSGAFDFSRFNVDFFRHLERRIGQLQEIGVEADLILFHPYDRWGFSRMSAWADDLYIRYLVRRLGAFRGVWWSLANEFDFLHGKTTDDWERIAALIQHEDHAGHLMSIHNGFTLYDHTRSWITHASIQRTDSYRTTENVDEWRHRFGKPIVVDECGYEGDIPWSWGNLTAEELVRRCWEGAVRGGYVNHGETFHAEDETLFWSRGGVFHGESPARIGFLARIIGESPTGRLEPLPDYDAPVGGDSDHRIMYLGLMRPRFRPVAMPPGTKWWVDIIDTWNMTVDTLPEAQEGQFVVDLPARPYIAVRFRRLDNTQGQDLA